MTSPHVLSTAPVGGPQTPGQAIASAHGAGHEVLLDTDDVIIELITLPARPAAVVVTFDPILLTQRSKPFAVDFLLKCGADVVSVRKKAENFYQPLSRSAFDAVVGPVLARYRRRLAYGSSLGAYAVLYFCRLGYDHVISSSPRVSAHPRFGTAHWQRLAAFRHEAFDPTQPATSPATVFYDPLDAQDRQFVQQEIQGGWPSARYVRLRHAGHPANQFLSEIGYITPFVRALVRDQTPPVLDLTRKAQSGMYLLTLGNACLARRKLKWAGALVDRALERAPYLDLARRAQAEVAMAQGRFKRSEELLLDYMRRQPGDGAGPLLMKRLNAQRKLAARARQQAERDAAKADNAAAAPADAPAPRPASILAQWREGLGHWLQHSDHTLAVQGHRLARRWRRLRAARSRLSRDDVVWAYQQFLGREPESEEAITSHLHLPSQRALVQVFLDSPEYQQRQSRQGAAGPGRATRLGAHGVDGPNVVVVGNCQAPGLAAVIAASCAVRQVTPLTGLNREPAAFRKQLADLAAQADVWMVNPGNTLARDTFAEMAKPGARLITVPALMFNAFHPDVCYAQHRTSRELTQQHYNSAIAAWAYTQGLSVERTAALFCLEAYEGLGYLEAWPRAMDHLRRSFEASDLREDHARFALHMQRQGCFMHTPNHPGLAAMTLLARLAAQRAGIPVFEEPVPGELADGLSSTIWPVYPEIAHALSLAGGSHTWRFVARNQYVRGVPAFVQQAFRSYERQGIGPADLELRSLNMTQLADVLGPLASGAGRAYRHAPAA